MVNQQQCNQNIPLNYLNNQNQTLENDYSQERSRFNQFPNNQQKVNNSSQDNSEQSKEIKNDNYKNG